MVEKLSSLMVASGAGWVLWLMFGLSFISVAVALERAWVFRGSRANVEMLVPALRKLLQSQDLGGAAGLLSSQPSAATRVVAAGLGEAAAGAAAAEEAMAATINLERRKLEVRLLFLGTVGNNAPFVGLLGTVIGIIGAFEGLARTQDEAGALAPERVMGSIAEALVATAVGLVIAIPAVAVFNALQGQVTAMIGEAETLGHVLLAHLRAEPKKNVPGGSA